MHNHEALPVTLDSSPPPTKNEGKKNEEEGLKEAPGSSAMCSGDRRSFLHYGG